MGLGNFHFVVDPLLWSLYGAFGSQDFLIDSESNHSISTMPKPTLTKQEYLDIFFDTRPPKVVAAEWGLKPNQVHMIQTLRNGRWAIMPTWRQMSYGQRLQLKRSRSRTPSPKRRLTNSAAVQIFLDQRHTEILAAEYSVSGGTISNIRQRRSYLDATQDIWDSMTATEKEAQVKKRRRSVE